MGESISLGFSPSGATEVEGTLLITHYEGGGIYALGDLETPRFSAPTSNPTGLAFRQEGDNPTLFIGDFTQALVSKVNADTGASLGSVTTPADNIRDIALQGDTLWVIQEERLELVAIDLNGVLPERVFELPLGEPAGVEFCQGFALVSDRTTNEVYVFDAKEGRLLGGYEVGDIDDPYGLACDDDTLYIVDFEGQALHQATLPTRNIALNPAMVLGDADFAAALGWDGCSAAYAFDLQGDPGVAYRTQLLAQGGRLGVALTAMDGTLLFSDEAEAREAIIPPEVTISEGQHYTLWVVALDGAPDFDLWATRDLPEVKTISGRVLDDDTEEAIPGALVQVADDIYAISAVADVDGRYSLSIPQVGTPDYVVVTASDPAHFPGTRQVNTESADETINFYLEPLSDDIHLIGATQAPVHLGNGSFSGTINSQFQTEHIGPEITFTFTLTQEQAERATAALSLFMKGAQNYSNLILLNDVPIDAPTTSPADGSYEELVMPIWTPLLKAGSNTLEVRAGGDGADDIDDFEFSSVLLRFSDLQAYDALGQWQLPTGFEPTGITWEGGLLYLSDYDAMTLYTFDPNTGALESQFALSSRPAGLAGTGNGELWVSLVDTNSIQRLDVGTFSSLQTIDEPAAFVRDVDLYRGMLWASDRDNNQAIAMSLADGAIEESYSLDIDEMAGLEFMEDNLWVVDRENSEIVIFERLDSPPVLVLRAYLEDPYALDSDGAIMWVTDFDSGRILAFAGSEI